MNVFWPNHLKYQGNFNAILTLDYCTAHDMRQFFLPTRIGIKFLTSKITSRHKPTDMVIISSLEVGYKFLYLRKLLKMFDTPSGFERAAVARRRKIRGYGGIEYGGKPHLLEFMMMLQKVWNGDYGKYVSD